MIRRIVANYRYSYLLMLSGYGDTDMINFYDEDGTLIIPEAARKFPVGRQLSTAARGLGIKSVIPFSSFHAYQRSDSIWAQDYVTPLEDYSNGFDHQNYQYIAPFSHIDCATGEVTALDPPSIETVVRSPEACGDNWSEPLERSDLAKISNYFRKKDLVRNKLSFLNFRVGSRDNFVQLDANKERGITFEVPRHSLMTAIEFEVFDDLLIDNFMKTTLHKMRSLYDDDFNFAVTKFGDNGRVSTYRELDNYWREYRRRASAADWYCQRASQMVTAYLPRESPLYRIAQRIYWTARL